MNVATLDALAVARDRLHEIGRASSQLMLERTFIQALEHFGRLRDNGDISSLEWDRYCIDAERAYRKWQSSGTFM